MNTSTKNLNHVFRHLALKPSKPADSAKPATGSDIFAKTDVSAVPSTEQVHALKQKVHDRFVAEMIGNYRLQALHCHGPGADDEIWSENNNVETMAKRLMSWVDEHTETLLNELFRAAGCGLTGRYELGKLSTQYLSVVARLYLNNKPDGLSIEDRVNLALETLTKLDLELQAAEELIDGCPELQVNKKTDRIDLAIVSFSELNLEHRPTEDERLAGMIREYETRWLVWMAIDIWRQHGKRFSLSAPLARIGDNGSIVWKREY